MMKNKRFLIASGGTGGHFYPGFALGRSLKEQGAQVLFVVRKDDPACRVLTQYQLPFAQLDLHTGLPRTLNPVRHVAFMRQLGASFAQTRRLISEFRPDVTLGMGGYVSFPLIFCSHFMGIKTAIHESNTIWGLSNRICGYFANLRLMGLPMAHTFKNAVLSSTPIRPEFAHPVDRGAVLAQLGFRPDKPTVLVTGGSQGARGLNEALVTVIKNTPHYQFIHLTGPRWYDTQQAAYAGLANVKTLAYTEEMCALMKTADVIISRSGASTLAEMIACQLPAILVPYPHAAANHQYFNAKVLADKGCADLVLEGPQLATHLQTTLAALTPDKLSSMRRAFGDLNIPNPLQATQLITHLLEQL